MKDKIITIKINDKQKKRVERLNKACLEMQEALNDLKNSNEY